MKELEDKWLICSTPKHGYAHNSLLFWGKNNCGHYPDLEDCEFYTEQEAKSHCYKGSQCVAIPYKELKPYLRTQCVGAEKVLAKYSK